MTEQFTELTAESLGGGDALSQLNEQLRLAIENIKDIDKDPMATRTVKLEIKFKYEKERQGYRAEFQASSKLPPDVAGVDHVYIHSTKNIGYVSVQKQMSLDEIEEHFDPETGEEIPLSIRPADNA